MGKRIARNEDALGGILDAARYSCTGQMVYRKWSQEDMRYVQKKYEVIPIDCGVTPRGNFVMFAQDYRDGNQIKQFIVKQIMKFEKTERRVRPSFPIQVRRLESGFGVGPEAVKKEASSGGRFRFLVARELGRIAQMIMQYSGADANQFRSEGEDPYSYNPVGDDGRGVVAKLNDYQKSVADEYSRRRKDGMEFGTFNYDGNGRYFVPLSGSGCHAVRPPDEIAEIIDRAGYWMPDYRQGKLYRKDDKEMRSRNSPKLLTVLKKELRGDEETFNRLKKMFDERDAGSNKRLDESRFEMCITHNPHDIAGMSTDRNWTSCMKLPDDEYGSNGGGFYLTALRQVEYGGLCAYLVLEGDREIERPIARIAVKRLENGAGDYIYEMEDQVYGDSEMASRTGFKKELKAELGKSNAVTRNGGSVFSRNDYSYSDSDMTTRYVNPKAEDVAGMEWPEIAMGISNGDLSLSEEEIGRLIDAKGGKPDLMFWSAIIPHVSEGFLSRYEDFADFDLFDLKNHRNFGEVKNEYRGKDKPADAQEMTGIVETVMEDHKTSDDWYDPDINEQGDVSMCTININPLMVKDLINSYPGMIPKSVVNFFRVNMSNLIKDFYEDETTEIYGWNDFSELDRSYWDGTIDQDTLEYLEEYVSETVYNDYNLEVCIAVRDAGAVDAYLLESHFYICFVELGKFWDAYSAQCVVRVNEDGWKEKLNRFADDLFAHVPRI